MGWTAVGTIATSGGGGGGGPGSPGQKGQDGANWLLTNSPPLQSQGKVGDLCFQSAPPGATGPILLKGDPGPKGLDGRNGKNGADGAAGASGAAIGVCNGRLTLTSLTPITTSEVTSSTSIFFTPYLGNQVSVYTGSAWTLSTFSELTLALGTLTSGLNYDVFITSGLALESLAWSSDTARATALTLQDGVYVKSGDATRRYLGTFRTISTTATADFGGTASQTGGKRFLWNMYNRKPRPLSVIDTTSSWVYSTQTWRQANGATGNKVEYVCGQLEDAVMASTIQCVDIAFNSVAFGGVGVNSITAPSGLRGESFLNTAAAGANAVDTPVSASYMGLPGLGYNYLAWLEEGGGSGTTTWTGNPDGGTAGRQSGLTALVYG